MIQRTRKPLEQMAHDANNMEPVSLMNNWGKTREKIMDRVTNREEPDMER